MPPAPSIVVVGSCMIDLTCFAPRLPYPGETIHGTSFNLGFGGKGANQAVAAAKLGAKVELVARLGDDKYGSDYLASLKENGVGHKHVIVTEGQHSGIAQITVGSNGENQIVIVPGANSLTTREDVEQARDILQKASVVVCQLETDPSLVLDTAAIVRPAGGVIILNAAPANDEIPHEILTCCDILCVNETEISAIVQYRITNVEEGRWAVTRLLEIGCKAVVLTLGAEGVVFASKEDPQPVHVATPEVHAVDTTGAGDSFIGAMAFYVANMPLLRLQEIVCRACQIAAMSVQKVGTQQSFPKRTDLPARLFFG